MRRAKIWVGALVACLGLAFVVVALRQDEGDRILARYGEFKRNYVGSAPPLPRCGLYASVKLVGGPAAANRLVEELGRAGWRLRANDPDYKMWCTPNGDSDYQLQLWIAPYAAVVYYARPLTTWELASHRIKTAIGMKEDWKYPPSAPRIMGRATGEGLGLSLGRRPIRYGLKAAMGPAVG